MSTWEFLQAHAEDVATRTLEHVALAASATLIATCVAVPIGDSFRNSIPRAS